MLVELISLKYLQRVFVDVDAVGRMDLQEQSVLQQI